MKTEKNMIKDLFMLMSIVYPIILIVNDSAFNKMSFYRPMVSYVIGNYCIAFMLTSLIIMMFYIIKSFIKCK